MLQISFQLRKRSEAAGKEDASAVAEERGLLAYQCYGMLFQAIEPLLEDMEAVPKTLRNGVGQFVVETACARIGSRSDATQDGSRKECMMEVDTQIVAAMDRLRKSFWGRLGGSFWSAILQSFPGILTARVVDRPSAAQEVSNTNGYHLTGS